MAKARKYRVWAATAESTSWEVAASLCPRSNYSLQKLLYISDKTMFNRRRVLFKPPTSKNETPLSRRHLPPWSSAPTTPPTAPCLCPLHRCWLTHQQSVKQLEHAQYIVLAASGSDGDNCGWKIICGLHSRPPSNLCLERRFWKIWRAHWRLPPEGDNYCKSMGNEIIMVSLDLWGATRSQRQQPNSPKKRTW